MVKRSYQNGGAQGGDQQEIIMQYLQAFAQMQQMEFEQLLQMLQQMPQDQQQEALQQIVQTVDQALSQQEGAQGQQGYPAQQSYPAMPADPNQAVAMALGGAYTLKKFTDAEYAYGGEAFPQAAPMYDNSIYRTMPPNVPRLMRQGGLTKYQTKGQYAAPAATTSQTESNIEQQRKNIECGFGMVYDASRGMCIPSTLSKIAPYPLGALGVYGAYKGIQAGVPYAVNSYRASPLTRPVTSGISNITDLSPHLGGKEGTSWRFYNQDVPKEGVTYEYSKTNKQTGETTSFWSNANDPDFETKVMNDKSVKPTGNTRVGDFNYKEYSARGNAEWVKKNITPKYPDVTWEKWAEMGKTYEGRQAQRAMLMGVKNPKVAAIIRPLLKMARKAKGPWYVKAGALAAIATAVGAYAHYNSDFFGDSPYYPYGDPNALTPEDSAAIRTYVDSIQNQNFQNLPNAVDVFGSYVTPPAPAPAKKYGGVTPFNYGQFPVQMAYGGSSNAMPGIYDTDSFLNDYNDNEFRKYIRENIDNSIYERMMEQGAPMNQGMNMPMARRGGPFKKKKT